MMSIFGTVKRGRKVVVVRGTGFEFTIHSAGARKTKNPAGERGINREALKHYNTHNTPLSDVNKKIDFRA